LLATFSALPWLVVTTPSAISATDSQKQNKMMEVTMCQRRFATHSTAAARAARACAVQRAQQASTLPYAELFQLAILALFESIKVAPAMRQYVLFRMALYRGTHGASPRMGASAG
jgi:hypothetical protein